MATFARSIRAHPGWTLLILLLALVTAPAYAQHHEPGGGGHFGGGHVGGGHAGMVRGGPVVHGGGHFNTFGRGGVPGGGRWFHGQHGGRSGWWWIAGPTWYYYAEPYYSYPDPYWYPDEGAYGAVLYFCPSVGGYYPYVTVCPGGWIIVNAP